MLTRFKVKGFKSLADAEVHFGPFTCIAGPNGSGKSNLFDAIMFLRDLADVTIVEAAARVRDRSGSKRADLASLFTKTALNKFVDIELEADFIVSQSVRDDFGNETKPSSTYLTYRLALRYLGISDHSERIELVREELTYVPKAESKRRIGFPVEAQFQKSVIFGERRAQYIATETRDDQNIIKLRQDGGRGRPLEIPASSSPRTVLGSVNTDERPTMLAARREMQSWSLLQLEPSKLRAPDEFSDDPHITYDGAHIPATLDRLKKFDEVSNHLASLIPEVRGLRVDVDSSRRLKTLMLEQRDGISHSARTLSDGTLRFLALAVLASDTEGGNLICLEEPENGIHPSRVRAIVKLLMDMAVDPQQSVSEHNPFRQVIINTHSPSVVKLLHPDDLLVATNIRIYGSNATTFAAIRGSWRTRTLNPAPEITFSYLDDYLTNNPGADEDEEDQSRLWWQAAEQGAFDFVRES